MLNDDEAILDTLPSNRRQLFQKRTIIALAVTLGAVVFAVAFGAGFATGKARKENAETGALSPDYDLAHEAATTAMLASNIENNLRNLTFLPHIAGGERNKDLAYWIADLWRAAGLDQVEIKRYDVLLSYPKQPNHGTLARVDSNGTSLFTADLTEPIATPDENKPNVVPPFNAYSPSGKLRGDLVYVNYARVEDFEMLHKWGIDIKGKIAIARYGKLFRGDKAAMAAKAGAIGLLLYSDPADSAPKGAETYPKSWWLPTSGVQRGTLLVTDGDPLTPNYPSVKNAYRRPLDKVMNDTLPQIPVLPISASNAGQLLKDLKGRFVSNTSDWQGGLGFSYRLGPGYEDGTTVYLEVNNVLETRPIYNVIGTIVGSVEQDRYVLLGNHRDAWVFGGVDPSGGTTCLIETVQGFAYMLKQGWRPRRTIKFCSWGAEEYGLIGSTEWGEEYGKIFGNRAVAYLNVDVAVEGIHNLVLSSSPLLNTVFVDAMKRVSSPDSSYESLYDLWFQRNGGKVYFYTPGSGTDYSVFFQHIGIPSSDTEFSYDYDKFKTSIYPAYHSVHDTFAYVKKFIDPNFHHHLAIARVWLQTAFSLSDERVLPLDHVAYAKALQTYVTQLEKTLTDKLQDQNISLTALASAVDDFAKRATSFTMPGPDASDLTVRMINDQLMQLERMFIIPEGLPGRPWYRHIVFAPSSHNAYASSKFPGIVDALFPDSPDWELVKQELSIALLTTQQASESIIQNH